MAASSTGAIFGDGIAANEPRAATGNDAQAVASPCVPNDISYSINRFLGMCKETGHGYQRPPLGYGKMQCDAEAEIEAETRIRQELRAFDAQFLGENSADK